MAFVDEEILLTGTAARKLGSKNAGEFIQEKTGKGRKR